MNRRNFLKVAPAIFLSPKAITYLGLYEQWEEITGIATTVGPTNPLSTYKYPWQTVLDNRKQGLAARGSITDGLVIEDFTRVVALHRVMQDHSLLGTMVLLYGTETGVWDWALVIDAMANPHRVADLSPEQFKRLSGYSTTDRGGFHLSVFIRKALYR